MNKLTPCGLSQSELMRSLTNPKTMEAAQLIAHIRNAGGSVRLTETGVSMALPPSSMANYFICRLDGMRAQVVEFLRMGEEETG